MYVTTEDGSFIGYDVRNTASPLFAFQAHSKAATTVTASSGVNGMVATASLDGLIKLWDVQTINEGAPLLVIEKNFKAVSDSVMIHLMFLIGKNKLRQFQPG